MNLDAQMNRFRLASRELFNHYFKIADPWQDSDTAWEWHSRFLDLEDVLFAKLVAEPMSLQKQYGLVQENIQVTIRNADFTRIIINREINSGYWDYPVTEVTKDAVLHFIGFFDWDWLDYHDNRYVRVLIADWDSQPDTIGKLALIESYHVKFELASASNQEAI